MKLTIGAAVLAAWGWQLTLATTTLTLSADGLTVYDQANGITWLANANLAASDRFGLPLCSGTASRQQTCVNQSGSMNYPSAAAWVAAMNAANYLGHSDWLLPTTPPLDSGCGKKGPNGNSFGFGCTASAFGTLYNALGLSAPNTAVPIPNNTVGPFSNFQPYIYWSQSSAGGSGQSTFSFNSGFNGANTGPNFLYLLPMIQGKITGTPPASGTGLQANPGGQTIYDSVANVTWLANANLAASNTFGLPLCTDPTTPAICVARDGAMTSDSANQFIANMNAYNGSGYLGQKNWQVPPVDPNCGTFGCNSAANPMGELFYGQFGLSEGMPVVAAPDIQVGPLHNIQPYLYWACHAATIQSPCEAQGPNPNMEWSFSFGSGFEGTDLLQNELYATAYFVGSRTASTGPVIAYVANAEGESPAIAPNTWVEIKGSHLAPAGNTRIWQSADFSGGKMPTQLDGVSVSVNGKAAYVYYISPTQIDILTPPDAMKGTVQVMVTNNGASSTPFTASAQAESPSFFVFNGGPYVAAVHAGGSLIGPASLYPGSTTPAKPGETILLFANGFGSTSTPVVSGSLVQSGTLSTLPVVTIGGVKATVQFAGLVSPGEFQFNVVVPASAGAGDQAIAASFNGVGTQAGTLITIAEVPTSRHSEQRF